MDDPELSGQLIDEMRKGECWDVLPRVLGLFAGAREPSAIIRFAIACPTTQAKSFIEELRKRIHLSCAMPSKLWNLRRSHANLNSLRA